MKTMHFTCKERLSKVLLPVCETGMWLKMESLEQRGDDVCENLDFVK